MSVSTLPAAKASPAGRDILFDDVDDMHLMLEYARRALVFHDGQMIADDSSAAVLTNSSLVRQASLKETSLYELAILCNIEDGKSFVQRFIDYEREEKRG